MTICKKNLIYLRIDKAKQTLVNLPLLGGIYEGLFRPIMQVGGNGT